MKTAILITMMLMSGTGFAQTEHGNGGGEDGVFKNIRNEIGTWLVKNNDLGELTTKLELKTMSSTTLLSNFDQGVKDVGDQIIFNHDEIKFGVNVRICKNDRNLKIITCNIDEWAKTKGDARYMIVFHEYLGIAGIEINTDEYSTYPISPKILSYVHTENSFELGMEKVDLIHDPLVDKVNCSLKLDDQRVKSDPQQWKFNEKVVFDFNANKAKIGKTGACAVRLKRTEKNQLMVIDTGVNVLTAFPAEKTYSNKEIELTSTTERSGIQGQFFTYTDSAPLNCKLISEGIWNHTSSWAYAGKPLGSTATKTNLYSCQTGGFTIKVNHPLISEISCNSKITTYGKMVEELSTVLDGAQCAEVQAVHIQ